MLVKEAMHGRCHLSSLLQTSVIEELHLVVGELEVNTPASRILPKCLAGSQNRSVADSICNRRSLSRGNVYESKVSQHC
ncbi:hypothetical protein [Nostoc sp. DedQUE09]|uniref:hypothetical protein n=1 Tax=Nostoc sp. DedQUE09 TaxID=3075394 RepID=UPI002AD55F1C|nr:hypothetical protein [Nostoc sp. DedQUE09]MDZ7954257.1 hypothetical protein [Nostoc sp. DedQUE09]